MRIRKNAKQSSLQSLSEDPVPESLRTQVCQLNQSPWDVAPFSPPTSPSYHPPPPYLSLYPNNYQFDGEDSLTGNGSFGDSIGAVESSVASMMDERATIYHDNYDNYCTTKSDDEMEEEPLTLRLEEEEDDDDDDGPSEPILESCGIHKSSTHYSSKKAQKQGGHTRRGRPRTVKMTTTKGSTSSSAANPYEFYYYSGFGPSWRKKRGDRAAAAAGDNHQVVVHKKKKMNISNSDHDDQEKELCDDNDKSIITKTQNNTAPFGGSYRNTNHQNHVNQHDHDDDDGFCFLDDDELEEDEDEDQLGISGRKRTRKPVKARSLKSLM